MNRGSKRLNLYLEVGYKHHYEFSTKYSYVMKGHDFK
jgi:hypothetical protein